MKHIDCEAETAVQDAREMRAKNGKSFIIRWFPVPDEIRQIVLRWKHELESEGFDREDALFPDSKYLTAPKTDAGPIPTLYATGAVNRAFRIASNGLGQSYSPHSVRHCLKALGDQLCTRAEERKAWSLNLGHESMVITDTHYGKMTDANRMQILGAIKDKDETSDDEKDLMLRYYSHQLVLGTPEYKKARALVHALEAKLDAVAILE